MDVCTGSATQLCPRTCRVCFPSLSIFRYLNASWALTNVAGGLWEILCGDARDLSAERAVFRLEDGKTGA
jgi:hypothetical protein